MVNKLETIISVNDGFSKGIVAFEKRVSTMTTRFRGLTKSFDSLKKSSTDFLFNIKNIGQSFDYIKLGVSGVFNALDKITSEGDELAKTSQRLGFTVEELQKFRYVSDLAGVSSDNFTKGMKKLSQVAVESKNPMSQQAKAFKALGISARNSNGDLKTSQELLFELSDRFAVVGDGALTANEKIFAAQTLFGKSGTELITVLNQGSAAIRGQMDELAAFGIMTADQARESEAYRDSVTRMTRAFNGLKISLAADLLGPMTESVKYLTDYLRDNKDVFIESFKPFIKSIPELAKTFTGALPGVVDAFKTVMWFGKSFIDMFGVKWPVMVIAAGGVLVPLVATLGSVVKIFYSAGLAVLKTGSKLVSFGLKSKTAGTEVQKTSRILDFFRKITRRTKTDLSEVSSASVKAAKGFDRVGQSAQKSMGKIKSSSKSALGSVTKLAGAMAALDLAGTFFEKVTNDETKDKGVLRNFMDSVQELPIIGNIAKGIENLSVDKVKFDDLSSNSLASAMDFGDIEDSELFNTTVTKTVNNNSHSTIDVNFNNVPKDTSITRRTFGDPSMYGFSMNPAF